MKTKSTLTMMLMSLLTVFQFASAATATFNITVPNDGGADGHHQTNRCMAVGNFQGWDPATGIECAKIDDTHYTVTLDESTFTDPTVTLASNLMLKFVCGPDWAYVMKGDAPEYAELDNIAFAGTSPQEVIVLAWGSVWEDVVPIPGYFTISLWAPKTVTEAYMTGSFNGWLTPGTVAKADSASTVMTLDAANSDATGNLFNITVYTSNAYALAFKFTTGSSWKYQQNEGNNSYPDPSQSTALFDAVGDATSDPVVAPKITFARIYPGEAGLKTVTLTATMPASTTTAFVKGSVNGASDTDFIAGTNNNDGTFTFSIPSVDIFEYKYYNTADASTIEMTADNTDVDGRTADAQLSTTFTTDIVAAWAVTNAVKELNANNYKVYSNNKSIVVEGVQSSVEVYSVDGRNIQSEKLSGNFTSKVLNNGIYIIRIDGATQKVSVK